MKTVIPFQFKPDRFKNVKVENVQLIERFSGTGNLTGSLFITTTHLIFLSPGGKETWILHTHVSSVERGQITVSGSLLVVRGKTFFTYTFIIPKDKECQDVYDTLLKLSRSRCIEELPAFYYMPSYKKRDQVDDCEVVSMFEDYARLGIPNDKWVLSKFNNGYMYSEAYPQSLCVPRSAALSVLIGSCKFRSRGRLPVLSYLHHRNGASICRCSQPLTGFHSRCGADEDLMHHILKTNPRHGSLFIVDTRPKINAMANKAVGKGFEDENNYSDVRYYFLPVENIHAMRSSLNKMLDTIGAGKDVTMGSFLSGLENSGWLRHIRSLLETALFIAEAVESGVTVVVHCSDGWDRTPQTTSLASIMLDPFYRTLHGFQVLVEKEWLKFGHKFSDRCGHIFQADSKETAPIFTQFLDCVWQLMTQFPQAFSFNENFLLTLHHHVYSCQFGTFLCNSDKERTEIQLAERTYSFWGYALHARQEFLNPLYDDRSPPSFLKPDLRPVNIRLWHSMYNRHDWGLLPRETLSDCITETALHLESLNNHYAYLTSLVQKFVRSQSEYDMLFDAQNRDDSGKGTSVSTASPVSDSAADESGRFCSFDLLEEKFSATVGDCSPDDEGAASLSFQKKYMLPEYISSSVRTVAVRWQNSLSAAKCSSSMCGTTFSTVQRRCHCWSCGRVFCARCVSERVFLPGHISHGSSPVCARCFGKIHRISNI